MSSEVKPVMEGIFNVGPPAKLIGAQCPECNEKFFPKPPVCPHCLGGVQEVELSTKGKIYTYAVLSGGAMYKLPLPSPVGWVDLDDDNLRIFTLLDSKKVSELDFGKEVSLRVEEVGVGNDNEPALRYYFTPDDGGDK